MENSARSIFKWFANNQMQGNKTKNHVLLNTNEKIIEKVETDNSQSEKLLGVAIDSLLSFEKNIANL